jgi:hypothetical protein
MVPLSQKCVASTSLVTRTMLDDNTWRAFGFRRRPRRGAFFNRFIERRKLERETVLLRELSAASFSAIFRWADSLDRFPHGAAFLAKLLEYCIDGITVPIWPVMRFDSRRDAIAYFSQAVIAYGNAADVDQPRIMVERLRDLLAQPFPPAWLVGSAFLFSHPNSYLFNPGAVLTEIAPHEVTHCDIVLKDPEFHYAIMRLLTQGQSGIPDDEE